MAQKAMFNNATGADMRGNDSAWSPLMKISCFIGCGVASWAVILAPFYLIG